MKRIDMVEIVGKKYLKSNIENDEFSYKQVLKRNTYESCIEKGAKREYKDIDIRFENERLSILIETKSNINKDKENNIIQLQSYINMERKYRPKNKIIAILASTSNDDVEVYYEKIGKLRIDEDYISNDNNLKTFEEYEDYFFGTKNNKEEVMKNTYALNELLHKNGIKEKIRSQFVGTCLLALKNGLIYKNLSNAQIKSGIETVLENLLEKNLNKAEKLSILKNKVLENQDVRHLKDNKFEEILQEIEEKIIPYINDKNTMGQDLLNLFFTTFNKYVGKSDKNQAFTPDHIVQFMCEIVGVNKNSRVLDPCCGSGAFLVRALTMALDDCDTEKEKENVKKEQIYGIEFEEVAYGLATTNMLIHGDGNSNIYQGSCFDKDDDFYSNAKINIVLMNPPYNATQKEWHHKYLENWKDKKQDPSKGFHYVYHIAEKVKTGKLAVLLPTACAIGNNEEIKEFKKKMLENHNLLAVFSLPSDLFHPGASASACCMVFDLGIKHKNAQFKKTFFGYYKEDGFSKKKNLGRVEKFENGKSLWKDIHKEWKELYFGKIEKVGLSVLKEVDSEDEWLAEAYMETDYSILTQEDFEKTIRDFIAYKVKFGDINEK